MGSVDGAREQSKSPLPQLAREDLSEAAQLISKAGASVEVEVPSVARKPPVAHVGDLPVGNRFEVKDEIHATTIWAVDLAPAEDHLTTVPNTTDLPGRESERDQDRIEDLRNEDLHNPVRTTVFRNQARTSMSRPRWKARPRHDWWMLSEAGEPSHVRVSAKGRGYRPRLGCAVPAARLARRLRTLLRRIDNELPIGHRRS